MRREFTRCWPPAAIAAKQTPKNACRTAVMGRTKTFIFGSFRTTISYSMQDAILAVFTKLPQSTAHQVSDARSVLENHLGKTILAIHLFGSAVDGGLKPLSDIDLLVTVRAPL